MVYRSTKNRHAGPQTVSSLRTCAQRLPSSSSTHGLRRAQEEEEEEGKGEEEEEEEEEYLVPLSPMSPSTLLLAQRLRNLEPNCPFPQDQKFWFDQNFSPKVLVLRDRAIQQT